MNMTTQDFGTFGS